MQRAATLFIGEHYFRNYTVKSEGKRNYKREILECQLLENTLWQANFFPSDSYVLKVVGQGFLRYQVRLMMAALVLLGSGEITEADISNSLKAGVDFRINYIVPGSGLVLFDLVFADI